MLNIFWFRKDLRIVDNRGLYEFAKNISNTGEFSFLYIKNKTSFNFCGQKRISFLLECLDELKEELNSFGFELNIIEGKSKEVFQKITYSYKAISIYCNEQVEPYCIDRDNAVKQLVEKSGGVFEKYCDSTIFTLDEIKNKTGQNYKIFTAFKNQCLTSLSGNHYKKIEYDLTSLNKSKEVIISDFRQYNIQGEYKILVSSEIIKGGRKEGINSLKHFYEKVLGDYQSGRNYPAIRATSMLSAHLHFGTVGIREAFRSAFNKLKRVKTESEMNSVKAWINELLWREFYYNITFRNPQITHHSFKKQYDNLKWNYDEDHFRKWCEGMTGFPIVDAGMRQLDNEGWMHNRLRMITAMFLTKDLLIDWRYGEKYFADKLIDLDFSNNNGGWQWCASSGADAQPYFRIFNPYLQSKKFDPAGIYIKKYVHELKDVPEKFIHTPNLMSMTQQKMYNVIIGKDYPGPIIDHKEAAKNAIKRFQSIKDNF